MKILILCMKPETLKTQNRLNHLSTIYAYFFNKYLGEYKDCEIEIDNANMDQNKANSLPEFDFCFITFTRGVHRMNGEIYNILRRKIKYQIITICENNHIIDKEDLLLHMMGEEKEKTLRVYWGADHGILKPLKSKPITVLVDHKYYGPPESSIHKKDMTQTLINSLLKYRKEGNDIVIQHIGQGKIHTVTDDYVIDNFRRSSSMDFRKICEYYNKADIFVVTHRESLGFSTIECAAAGALIVQPQGFIKKEIIEKMHHYTIQDIKSIDWNDIISKLDVEKSVEMSKFFSYKNAADKLYSHMSKIYK